MRTLKAVQKIGLNMDQIRFIPVYAVLGFVFYQVVVWLQKKRIQSRLAKEWNCEPCVKARRRDPLGILTVRRLITSAAEGRLMEFIGSIFENTSKAAGRPVYTLQSRMLNSVVYTTTEPRNIQTVLATKFHDFDLGSARHGTFAPL